jgi:hypothetical protein
MATRNVPRKRRQEQNQAVKNKENESPQTFYKRVTKRPDMREILKRLAQ